MSGFLATALAQQRDATPGAEVWRGVVQTTATTVTERLLVALPAFAPDLAFGPCRWTPRFEPHVFNLAEPGETDRNVELARIVYPHKGDDCLVAFDENDEPWIVLYSPAGT